MDTIAIPVALPVRESYRDALAAAIRALADKIESLPEIEVEPNSQTRFRGEFNHFSCDHGNQIGVGVVIQFDND